MSLTESHQAPPVSLMPSLFTGMVSPLWKYYAALMTAGLAFWGLARVSEPVNLESALEAAPIPADPVEFAPEPPTEFVEPPVETLAAAPIEAVVAVAPVLEEPAIEAVDAVAPASEPIQIVKAAKPAKTAVLPPSA